MRKRASEAEGYLRYAHADIQKLREDYRDQKVAAAMASGRVRALQVSRSPCTYTTIYTFTPIHIYTHTRIYTHIHPHTSKRIITSTLTHSHPHPPFSDLRCTIDAMR